jgi:hypothetical protein
LGAHEVENCKGFRRLGGEGFEDINSRQENKLKTVVYKKLLITTVICKGF